jgi:hypothetical protein
VPIPHACRQYETNFSLLFLHDRLVILRHALGISLTSTSHQLRISIIIIIINNNNIITIIIIIIIIIITSNSVVSIGIPSSTSSGVLPP